MKASPEGYDQPGYGALLSGVNSLNVSVANYKEFNLVSGLAWSPIRGFEIGAEVLWMRGILSRPIALANDVTLLAADFPAFRAHRDLVRALCA